MKINKIQVICLVLSMLSVTSLTQGADAPTAAEAMEQARNFGKTGNDSVANTAKNTDPAQAVPSYQGTDIPEKNLYGEGLNIENRGIQALPGSSVGTYVRDTATTRPRIRLDPNTDPLLTQGSDVMNNPDSVLGRSLTGQYSGCQDVTTTVAPETFTTEYCSSWGRNVESTCSRTLNIDVNQPPPIIIGVLDAAAFILDVGTITVNLQTGEILSAQQNKYPSESCAPSTSNPFTCPEFWAKAVQPLTPPSTDGGQTYTITGGCTLRDTGSVVRGRYDATAACRITQMPSKENGWIAVIELDDDSGGSWYRYGARFVFQATPPPELTERWTDSCATARLDNCEITRPEQCVEPSETRWFGGGNNGQGGTSGGVAGGSQGGASGGNTPARYPQSVKNPQNFHPGFYMAIGHNDSITKASVIANDPNFAGVKKRYRWRDLETAEGTYDFSKIENDIAYLRSIGKQLFVSITFTVFSDASPPIVPKYMWSDSRYGCGEGGRYYGAFRRTSQEGGWLPCRGNATFDGRLRALYSALGKRFNTDPNFEGINLGETSTGRNPNFKNPNEKLDVFKSYALAAKQAFPDKTVMQMINYANFDLKAFGDWLASRGIATGGPDVHVARAEGSLATAYSVHKENHWLTPNGIDVQWDNWTKGGQQYSSADLLNTAVDYINPWYMFWANKPGYFREDVIPTVNKQGLPAAEAFYENRPSGSPTPAGIPVFKECWRYETGMACVTSNLDEEPYCDELRQRGCSQISARCSNQLDTGECLEYEQSFRCPAGDAVTQTVLNCGDQTYCLDGNCFDASYEASPDFALAVSHLGAAEAVAKDFDKDNMVIFKGEAMKCKKQQFGFTNCCKDKGWGNDLGLAQCKEQEKVLGMKREAGQCHYAGSYKSGGILDRRKYYNYCCFNSKLARIIQEQGRPQLGLNWGSGRHPSCRGFTPDELTRIDFSLIDFSEFYADAMQKGADGTVPDTGLLQDLVERRIGLMKATTDTNRGR